MKPPGFRCLLLALVLTGCTRTTDATTTPPQKVHEPDEGVALDDDQVEIAGQLLAHDGTPLRHAELSMHRDGIREPVASAVLGDDGTFRVSIPPGIYGISIAAVDHGQVFRRTVVTDDLRVEGRLGTYARTDPGESLKIRSEYLDAEGKVLAHGPSSAARVSEGIHRLELTGKPQGASRLRYQIATSDGRTYNGPLADDYQNDGGGDYWSIVDVSTKDALELDLSALPPSGVSPQLQWTGESPTTTAVIALQDRCFEQLGGIRKRMTVKDGKIRSMSDELRAELEATAAKARADVDAATDPTTHALLRAVHVSCYGPYLLQPEKVAPVREEVAWVLDHVSPSDPHPGIILNFDNVMFMVRRDADEAFLAKVEAWIERRAREHADPSAAIQALRTLLALADDRGDDARIDELYALAMNQRFDGTLDQQHIKKQFDPSRVLKRGNQLPAFDFAGLRQTEPHVASADRAGKLYVMEFWATWCGPCVADMPKLHATYAAINGAKPAKGKGKAKAKKGKGKGKGATEGNDDEAGLRTLQPVEDPKVEFVFISLDADPADVESFRKEHWPMPWTHGFVGRSGEKEVMERFGFFGVPTMILVDEKGTILEYGNDLRGEKLQLTLERVLAERSAPSP